MNRRRKSVTPPRRATDAIVVLNDHLLTGLLGVWMVFQELVSGALSEFQAFLACFNALLRVLRSRVWDRVGPSVGTADLSHGAETLHIALRVIS
jgi:hypothetical protein